MNFQKASTTLDASVKIYGYRVDDTLNMGYRILDGFNRGEQPKQQEGQPKQSRKLGVVNTLETNLQSIQMDSSAVVFDADPLFHLMSRRFDEGGAKGLLLSNLVAVRCSVDRVGSDGRLQYRVRFQRGGGDCRYGRASCAAGLRASRVLRRHSLLLLRPLSRDGSVPARLPAARGPHSRDRDLRPGSSHVEDAAACGGGNGAVLHRGRARGAGPRHGTHSRRRRPGLRHARR